MPPNLLQVKTEKRGSDSYCRYIFIMHLLLHKDAEGKQTQDRTVCVACQNIYGIDYTGIVQQVEYKNRNTHYYGHSYVYPFPDFYNFLFRPSSCAENIYGEDVVRAVSAEPAAE